VNDARTYVLDTELNVHCPPYAEGIDRGQELDCRLEFGNRVRGGKGNLPASSWRFVVNFSGALARGTEPQP